MGAAGRSEMLEGREGDDEGPRLGEGDGAIADARAGGIVRPFEEE